MNDIQHEPGIKMGGFSAVAETGLRNPESKVATVGRETTGFVAEHVDATWINYGIRTIIGSFYRDGLTPKKYQLVELEPYKQRKERMTIVKGLSFKVIPNEIALRVGDAIAEKHGFKQDRVEYGKNGLSVYASYVSRDRAKEVRVGDMVAMGFQIKNSEDGSVGFAIEGYTLRLVCSNGMTVPEHGDRFSLMKSSKVESIIEQAETMMEPLLLALEEQMETYKRWTTIQMNMQLANILAVSLPKKYLPFIDFVKKTRAVAGFQSMTVWDAFNRITDPLTHTKLEARHREWFRARLNRAVQLWTEVQSGVRTMDDAIEVMRTV
ncbi:MAG: DUF932 domain-containing protein [Nitrososphaerota archaeon]